MIAEIAVWFNYALLAQFFVLAVVWYFVGDTMQAVFWLGGFLCNAAITFRP